MLTAIAPFYWIYSGPETLLIIQTVVISIGALFIYKISKQNLKDERFSLVFALVYLLYPPLQWSNTFDFHAVTLATTFILALIYFAGRQKYLLSSVFFFLALLGKEQVGLTTALIGLYFYFAEKKRRFGIFLFLSSLAWSIISFLLIIPLSRQGAHFALERYSGITDPFKVAGQLIQFSTTSYLVRLFFPIAFLAVFSPFVAAILPELVINLLSSNFNQRGIIHHYTAVITPVVFIAAIFSAKYIIKRFEFDKKIIAGFLITASLVASYLYSPLPYSRQADTRPLRQTSPNAFDIYSWQKKLSDENINIAATGTIAPFFSSRKTIIRFSESYKYADFVVLLRSQAQSDWLSPDKSAKAYRMLENDTGFLLVEKNGDFEVYKKIYNQQ